MRAILKNANCVVCGRYFEWEQIGAGAPRRKCDEHRNSAAPKAPAPVKVHVPVTAAPAPVRERILQAAEGEHENMPLLILCLEANVHVMLVGPAGSGKTTAGFKAAMALGISFASMSCNPQMSAWDLTGFQTADGTYKPTPLALAFENGGLILLDEVDSSNAGVLTVLNAIAAAEVGQIVTLPDGRNVARHPDFHLVCGSNTWGMGADENYLREQLDAATLDRFAGIAWDYDEESEFRWVGVKPTRGTVRRTIVLRDSATDEEVQAWVAFIQRARAAGRAHGLVITPRASIMGARLLRAGLPREIVESLTLWKGMGEDLRRTISRAAAA